MAEKQPWMHHVLDGLSYMETIPAKSLIHKTRSPAEWFGADYNMNIYRGCPHGCIYCDSRSVCYQNPDFDTVKQKEDALRILRDDLRRKVRRGVVGTGAMSDPYNTFEKDALLTRNALELLNAYEFGAAIDTKSPLVARDADILSDIKRHSPVIVKITVTTADDKLCGIIEPRAARTSERFDAMRKLAETGIFCGVLMMPLLPFINDTEENVLAIVRMASAAGAKFVYPSFGMTLRTGNREYFYENLDKSFPGIKQKYVERYGDRYICSSPDAKRLQEAFKAECERLGLRYDMRSIIRHYKMPYEDTQLSLF